MRTHEDWNTVKEEVCTTNKFRTARLSLVKVVSAERIRKGVALLTKNILMIFKKIGNLDRRPSYRQNKSLISLIIFKAAHKTHPTYA